MRVFTVICILSFALAAAVLAQTQSASNNRIVERIGDTGFIDLHADSFPQLDTRHQALAYWLVQTSIAIDPIIYDQLSQFGVREKRLLEEIASRPAGIDPQTFKKIRDYALLFWANRGEHNENTGQKFLPTFTFEELQNVAVKVQAAGAFKTQYADLGPLATAADLQRELTELRPALFDATFEPLPTAKTPPPGQDIIQASSNTFYRGVTLQDLKNFQDQYPLNSRVVKDANGRLREEVYRAGTPDGRIPAGLYAVYLKKANEYLD